LNLRKPINFNDMLRSSKIRYWLFACIFTFASSGIFAQNTIAYGYDDNGNRTSRALSVQKSAYITLPASEKDIKVKDKLSDAESKIKIYPNPTSGIIRISLENYPDAINGRYQVYNLSGTILKDSRFDSSMTEINMSDISNGIYVLRLIINGNRSDYKIIKQN